MDFSLLNKEQLAAATYSGKHLLVLAGAGTGKTRTIIARAVHLIESGVPADRIKILSYTRKSAQEIVQRIKAESRGNDAVRGLRGSTFHAWCMELIQRFPEAFGLVGYSCIDADDRETAFKLVFGRAFGRQSVQLEGSRRLNPVLISTIHSFALNTRCALTDAICSQMGLDCFQQGLVEQIQGVCQAVIRDYTEYKRVRRYIDYDDMLTVVASTLVGDAELRLRVSSLYEHILIDEMQDTNPLQWMLLESFYDRCHLFCVGDDAQSIYAFRGADFKSIHSFQTRVPDAEVYRLTENYRSTQEILDLSNWLLRQSPLTYDKDLVAHRGPGKKPLVYSLGSFGEEADLVTGMVLKGVVEGKSFRDYLVLARGAFSCRILEALCITKGIPYRFYGGTQLMRSAHVRDVVSVLRIVSNPHDELAWARYLTLWPGLNEARAARLVDVAVGCKDVRSAVTCIPTDRGVGLKDILLSVLDYSSDPAAAIDLVVQQLEPMLNKRYDNWTNRKADFDALKIVAAKCADIPSFITEFILDPVAEQTWRLEDGTEEDFVIISTIHSAKGLEADTCFIINVAPDTCPSLKALSEDEVEEERRCLYVALTRAKNTLNIMARKVDPSPDATFKNERYFLKDLPDHLVDYAAGD